MFCKIIGGGSKVLIKKRSILTLVLIFAMILSMGVTFASKSPGSIHLVLSDENVEGNNPLFENKSSVFVSLSNFMPGTYDIVVKAPGSKGTILGTEKIEVGASGSLLFNLYELIPFSDTDNEAGVYTVVVDGNKLKNFKLETNVVDPEDPGDPEEPSEQELKADSLIENMGFIPIANGDELNRIRNEYPEGELFGQGTKWERQYITRGLLSNYVLVSDIDLSTFSNWIPIGDSTNRFSGVFDGNNYSVKNLKIDSLLDYVGLFGSTVGQLRDLNLVDPLVRGNNYVGALSGYHWVDAVHNIKVLKSPNSNPLIQGRNFVGGVIGFTRDNFMGRIINEADVVGEIYVGGIVGQYHMVNYIHMRELYLSINKGNVTGVDGVGGIVGNNSRGLLSKVFNEGNILGGNNVGGVAGRSTGDFYYGVDGISEAVNIGYVKGSDFVGGLVGRFIRDGVADSYNTGVVEGINHVGGAIGGSEYDNTWDTINSSVMNRSYSTGEIIGLAKDGLVGRPTEMTVNNSYYNSDLSNTSISGIGIPLTNEEMTNPVLFSAFDFSNKWVIVPGETYPYLKWHEEFYIPLKINLN